MDFSEESSKAEITTVMTNENDKRPELEKLISVIFRDNLGSSIMGKSIFLQRSFKLLAYEGPNIIQLLRTIIKRMTAWWSKATPEAKWEYSTEGMRSKYVNGNQMVARVDEWKDVAFINFKQNVVLICIMIFVLRGGNWEKIISTGKGVSEDAVFQIKRVAQILDLKSTLPKNDKSSTVLTLARVGMCFPHFVVAIMKYFQNFLRNIPGRNNEELPIMYCSTMAPSIWSPEDWKTYQGKHLEWMVEFTRVTQAKITNEKDKTSKSTLESIQRAAYNSTVFTPIWRKSQADTIVAINPLVVENMNIIEEMLKGDVFNSV